jgi:ATP-binding cassette subfamily F protein 3
MIVLDDITLKRGGHSLFEHLDLTIHPGQHVGLVGRNGVGKSSLFALLKGQLLAEVGDVRIPPRWRIAYLAQETQPSERSALDWALDGDDELRRVEREIRAAEARDDNDALAHLYTRFDDLGGYSAAARAAEILSGLGFAATDHGRAYREFSGGWRIRLNLAQTLMAPAELLLLDEPTNHLDLDAMLWLESHLRQFAGTLLVIAHDREFLDAVTTHTVHLEQGRATQYRGNYSAFERQRGEALARQTALARQQAKRAAEIRNFVERFRAKASKARQVQSRLKALEKLEQAESAHTDSPYQFSFPNPARMSRSLVHLDAAALGYGNTPLLRTGELRIVPGARIGILGVNGAGKTTLLRTLAGELAPMSGTLSRGRHSAVGYFAQHQLELLDPALSALEHIGKLPPLAPEQQQRDHLGGWGFSGDAALRPTGTLSGGEKARLVLGLIAWQRPALLLLDEPTNHLDIEMRHALSVALQTYQGALVLVSHDRDLLARCVDEFWLVSNGNVAPFSGDLSTYAERVRQAQRTPTDKDSESRRARRQNAAQERLREEPLRRKLKELERTINGLNRELAELEEVLADPATYTASSANVPDLLTRRAALTTRLEAVETEWVDKQQQLESGAAHSPKLGSGG